MNWFNELYRIIKLISYGGTSKKLTAQFISALDHTITTTGGGVNFTNIYAVDPDSDSGAPFQTVQAAIDAIEALDPVPNWPIIEVGNFNNNSEDVTTALRKLVIRGAVSRDGGTFTANILSKPFKDLIFTEPDADVELILENCSCGGGDVIANNGAHNLKIQLLNSYLSAIIANGDAPSPGGFTGNTQVVIVDGGGNSAITDIYANGRIEVYNFANPVSIHAGDGLNVRAVNSNISGVNSTPGDTPVAELQLLDSFATSSNAAATVIEEQNLLIKPPTSDPLIEGVLWNDSGTPTISAGPPP